MNWLEIANATAAWLALVLTVGGMIAAWVRRRREVKEAAGRNLHLETSSLGDDEMYVRVRYDAPSGHTRYSAKVQVIRPTKATLSPPRYVSRNSLSDIVVLMPGPAWDPRAKQTSVQEFELVDATPRAVSAEMVLKGLEQGRAMLRVRVVDLADTRVLVDERRALRA